MFKRCLLVLKHPGGGGSSRVQLQLWCLLGQTWGGLPAPTAWLGLRILPVSSWFASGGEQPPVATADLELEVLSRIFVVLDHLAFGTEAKLSSIFFLLSPWNLQGTPFEGP